MRTESRVTGAGPHPGGAARWARRGMRPHPDSMASRPAGRLSVQQLDSEVRRPGGPRDPAPPAVGVAGGSRTPDSDGTDEHGPATRTVASSEPHTGSSPLASSPGPATEFDLPTRAGRSRHVPPTTGSPDHGPAPGDGARTSTDAKG